MKLLLCLFLALSLSQAIPILGSYQAVDPSEINSSPTIQNLAQYGLSQIVSQAINDGKITTNNFQISQINSVSRQYVFGVNYQYNCEFTNYRGTTITATFTIYYLPWTNDINLVNYNYQVTKSSTSSDLVDQSFVQLSIQDVQYSKDIQSVVTFGIKEFINLGIQDQLFPNSTYKVSQITSISRQIVNNIVFYKCSLQLTSSLTTKVNSVFTVFYQPADGSKALTDYSYQAQQYQANVNISSVRLSANSFSQLNVNNVYNDDTTYDILDYGSQQVVSLAISAGIVPDTAFDITNLASAYRQTISRIQYYRFACRLENDDGVTLDALFVVAYNSRARKNKSSLHSYSYQVTSSQETTSVKFIGPIEASYKDINIQAIKSDGNVQQILTYGIKNTLSAAIEDEQLSTSDFTILQISQAQSQVIGNGIFYRFACVLTNKAGANIQTSFVVYSAAQTSEKKVTAYSYQIQTSRTQVVSTSVVPNVKNWRQISADQVEGDSSIYNVLQFGVDAVVQKAVAAGNVPNTDFDVSSIILAYTQKARRGTLYQFFVEIDNGQGAVIDTNFTVYYIKSGNQKTLTSYNYNSQTTRGTTFTVQVQSIQGNYTQVNISSITTNKSLQTVLQFGIQQVINKGIQEGKLSAASFTIKTINSIFSQQTTIGYNYKFDVTLDNQKGTSVAAVFTVFQDSRTQQSVLSQYSYNSQTTTTVTTTQASNVTQTSYVNITLATLTSDKFIQSQLSFGVAQIINKGVQDQKIPATQFNITQVVSAASQNVSTGAYYQFQVALANIQGTTINANCTVFYNKSTQNRTLVAYSYNVFKATTTTTTTAYVDTAFTNVPIQQIQYDKEMQSCLQFGAEQIIQKAGNFTITAIDSIGQQIVDSSVYYKFQIEFSDKANTTLQATFTVFYQPTTQQKSLQAYSYSSKTVKTTTTTTTTTNTQIITSNATSYNASQKFVQVQVASAQANLTYQDALNYGVQQCVQNLYSNNVIPSTNFTLSKVLDVYKQESDSNSETYKFTVAITNKVDINLNVDFNVKYTTSTKSKLLTSYSAQSTSSSSAGSSVIVDYDQSRQQQVQVGSYSRVGISEVQSDTNIQAALQFGIQQTLKQVVQKETFSAIDFKLQAVNSIFRQSVDSNSYQVDTTCKNSKGQSVNLNFALKFDASASIKQVLNLNYFVF